MERKIRGCSTVVVAAVAVVVAVVCCCCSDEKGREFCQRRASFVPSQTPHCSTTSGGGTPFLNPLNPNLKDQLILYFPSLKLCSHFVWFCLTAGKTRETENAVLLYERQKRRRRKNVPFL